MLTNMVQVFEECWNGHFHIEHAALRLLDDVRDLFGHVMGTSGSIKIGVDRKKSSGVYPTTVTLTPSATPSGDGLGSNSSAWPDLKRADGKDLRTKIE